MGLKDKIRAVQKDLPISKVHDRWLIDHPNPSWSQKALDFAAEQLAGISGSQRLRKKMIRASGAGSCVRRQIFNFLNMPRQESMSSESSNILHTGNYLHLKWQMMGLTAGWLAEAEVPMDRPEWNAGGTADGVLTAGGGFEFKSINDRGYNQVMTYGPKSEHLAQTDTYMLLGQLDRYSIVYENKNTGEWREFINDRNEDRMVEAKIRIDVINEHLTNQTLPPRLAECEVQEGMHYRFCPFKETCFKYQRSIHE